MSPQNWILPALSLFHFWPSVEITWSVVFTLSALNDMDLMLACPPPIGSASEGDTAIADANRARAAAVLRQTFKYRVISLS